MRIKDPYKQDLLRPLLNQAHQERDDLLWFQANIFLRARVAVSRVNYSPLNMEIMPEEWLRSVVS